MSTEKWLTWLHWSSNYISSLSSSSSSPTSLSLHSAIFRSPLQSISKLHFQTVIRFVLKVFVQISWSQTWLSNGCQKPRYTGLISHVQSATFIKSHFNACTAHCIIHTHTYITSPATWMLNSKSNLIFVLCLNLKSKRGYNFGLYHFIHVSKWFHFKITSHRISSSPLT